MWLRNVIKLQQPFQIISVKAFSVSRGAKIIAFYQEALQ